MFHKIKQELLSTVKPKQKISNNTFSSLLVPKAIGEDVWIGMRAVILPQCRQIGAGAVIGAGAIVVHDVPAGAIVAGNPARVIGHRDAAQQVAA